MGILVHTSFETPQGFSVSSVYARIASVTYDSIGSGQYRITLKTECHLSRDARLGGKRSLAVPLFPDILTLDGTLGDMTYLYGLLKGELQSQGVSVEDVLEPTPEASQQSSE